jgi:hypothetical protein
VRVKGWWVGWVRVVQMPVLVLLAVAMAVAMAVVLVL